MCRLHWALHGGGVCGCMEKGGRAKHPFCGKNGFTKPGNENEQPVNPQTRECGGSPPMMKKRKRMRCEKGNQLCDKGTVSEGDREKSAATALVAKLTHSFQMKCLMSLVVNDSVATNDFFHCSANASWYWDALRIVDALLCQHHHVCC